MQLEFATYSDRQDTGLPEARLVNMYPQLTKAGPGQSARLPRPGLERVYSLGAAAIAGLFQQDGVFDGDLFAVCGTGLFRGETNVGTVEADASVQFAASPTQLVAVSGYIPYCYDGTTVAPINVDGYAVSGVATAGYRFYYPVADSDRVYFSDLDDATTVNALSFFTVDSQPDGIVGVGVQSDTVIFFGRGSTEFWNQTGDQDAPLIRSQGSTYSRGCASRRSIVKADNRYFWLGDDLKIYTLGAPDRVSTHAIEEQLRKCETPGDVSAFAVSWDGNDFVVFTIPGRGTYALHIESGEWGEWSSFGRTTFRGQVGIMAGATAYIGDMFSGAVFRLADVYTDDGDPMECIATVLAPPGVHTRVELNCSVGVGLEGNATPLVEMRYSNDQGRTFGPWRPRSLGLIGHYLQRVRWERLGLARSPRPYQFRSTDPVKKVFVSVEADIA